MEQETCHECKDIVEKLNEEFDTLQNKNIALEKDIIGLKNLLPEDAEIHFSSRKEFERKKNKVYTNTNMYLDNHIQELFRGASFVSDTHHEYWYLDHNINTCTDNFCIFVEVELNKFTKNTYKRWIKGLIYLLADDISISLISIKNAIPLSLIDLILTDEKITEVIMEMMFRVLTNPLYDSCVFTCVECKKKCGWTENNNICTICSVFLA